MAQTPWSQFNQLQDHIYSASYKFLFLDKNQLDGTFRLLGNPDFEVGYGDTSLTEEDYYFPSPITVNITFTLQEITKICVVGNDKLNQFPSLYTVEFFNNDISILKIPYIIQTVNDLSTTLDTPITADKMQIVFYAMSDIGICLKVIEMGPDDRRYATETETITTNETIEVNNTFTNLENYKINISDLIKVKANIPQNLSFTLSTQETIKIISEIPFTDLLEITESETEKFRLPKNESIPIYLQEINNLQNIHSVMKSPTRQIFAKVRIKYSLDDFLEGTTISANENVVYNCTLDNLYNGKQVPGYKYLFLNENTLDGSYHPMQSGSSENPVGFYSESDSTGTFATPIVITINQPAKTVYSLNVVGDSALNQYPTNFKIELYGSLSDTVPVYTKTVQNNTLVEWTYVQTFQNITKQVLTIYSINNPNESLILQEVYGAIIEYYYNDEIMSIDILEESTPYSTSITLGEISSNQLNLVLFNKNKRFAFGYNATGYENLLKANREIKVWFGAKIGTEIFWQPMGTYYSGPWQSQFSTINSTTLANDRLSLLTNPHTVSYMENTNAYAVFETILQNAGLGASEYVLDTNLTSSTIDKLILPFSSSVEALAYVAKCVLCYIYCDRTGRINIQKRAFPTVPQVVYLPSDIFDYITIQDQRVVINDVTINYTNYTVSDLITNIIDDPTIYTLVAGESLSINVIPTDNAFLTSLSNIVVTADTGIDYTTQVTTWGISINATNTTNTSLQITNVSADGIKLINGETKQIKQFESTSILNVGRFPWVYDNPLIQNSDISSVLATDILDYHSTIRPILELDCRGDFAVDVSYDVVAQSYDNFSQWSFYKQVRAKHEWDGAYRAYLTLDFEGRVT